MVKKTEWKQDGTVIKIKDMDDNHLRNTIKLMVRHGTSADEVLRYRGFIMLERLQDEELCLTDTNMPLEEIIEKIYPMYNNMLKEADKRKLEVKE